MPIVMLAVQFGLGLLLAKAFTASLSHFGSSASIFGGAFSEGGFILLGFGLSLIGLWIVYVGTQDVGLTVGYFAVQWIEGFMVTMLVASSLFAGGISSPLLNALAKIRASLPKVPAVLSNPPSLAPTARTASNQQGVILSIEEVGRSAVLQLTAFGPPTAPYLLDGPRQVPLSDSVVRVSCVQATGTRMSFVGRWRPGSSIVAWPTSSSAAGAIADCGGNVTLAGGRTVAFKSWTL